MTASVTNSPEGRSGLRAFDKIDPLSDPRWNRLVLRHPDASVFHTVAWLEALRRTYGYEPVVYTSFPPAGELQDGALFCRVDSWLTGRRLVSLPFSDHCEPLVDPANLEALYSSLASDLVAERRSYFEIRPKDAICVAPPLFSASRDYALHVVDLTPDIATLFRNIHRSSTQRKIARAAREGIAEEQGTSEEQLDAFYRLLVATRKRHRVPPQPKAWFRNLIHAFGDRLTIRLARFGRVPVAAILTLRHKATVTYKYGASDTRWNRLGGMQLLLWRTIEQAKQEGMERLDLGRSDIGQTGLITFKDRWGASRLPLRYFRFSQAEQSVARYASGSPDWRVRALERSVAFLPDAALPLLGRIVGRHVG